MGRYGSVILDLVRALFLVVAEKKLLFSFLVIKIILGVNLISYATRRRAGMEARTAADIVNHFGRDPIGEGKDEQVSVLVLYRPTDCVSLRNITAS